MELLKYKGYKGSVSITQDGEYKGVVLGLERNAEYTGKSFEELKQQFKCKVENLLHYCEHEGINPDYFVSTEKNTMQSKKYLVVFGVLGFAWLAWLWFYFDTNIGTTGIAQQPITGVGETSDWWKDAGSFFNNFSTPVLSLLSFIALLWTIYQQIASHKLSLEELRYTREELELTRNELKKSADAQELTAKTAIEQQKLIQLQQFESTFFSLLSNHEVAVSKIQTGGINNVLTIDLALYELINSGLNKNKFNFFGHDKIISYFIVLYQMLKFVQENYPHKEGKSEQEKIYDEKKYTSLIRAYLPNKVLILLFFNCYRDEVNDKKKGMYNYNDFKDYKEKIERYSFLEHINFNFSLALYSCSKHGIAHPCESRGCVHQMKNYEYNLFDENYSYINSLSLVFNSYSSNAFGTNSNIVMLNFSLLMEKIFFTQVGERLSEFNNLYELKEKKSDLEYNIERSKNLPSSIDELRRVLAVIENDGKDNTIWDEIYDLEKKLSDDLQIEAKIINKETFNPHSSAGGHRFSEAELNDMSIEVRKLLTSLENDIALIDIDKSQSDLNDVNCLIKSLNKDNLEDVCSKIKSQKTYAQENRESILYSAYVKFLDQYSVKELVSIKNGSMTIRISNHSES